jgi:hypothetical protein
MARSALAGLPVAGRLIETCAAVTQRAAIAAPPEGVARLVFGAPRHPVCSPASPAHGSRRSKAGCPARSTPGNRQPRRRFKV